MRVKSDKCSCCKIAMRSTNHRYCNPCRALYMRGWRKKHPLSEDARIKKNTATYICMAVKRGKLEKKSCQICGAPDAVGRAPDSSRTAEVFWSCKACDQSMKVD